MLEASSVIALDLFWKSTAVLLAACLAALALRRAAAALRHAVWALALSSLLLLPGLEEVLPAWGVPGLQRAPVSVSGARHVVAAPLSTPAEPAQSSPLTWPVFGGIWMAGTLICLIRWATAMWAVARIRRQAAPVTDG